MSNNDEQDITDIVVQLQELHLQQSILLTRLASINERNTEGEYYNTATDTPQDFQIGDRVRITNPKRFQAKKGVIINIGEARVTIRAPNGTKIQQAPENLILDN